MKALATAVLVLMSSCLEPTHGQIDLPGFDKPAEKAIDLPAGKHLSFATHFDELEWSGLNGVQLDVTMLKAGAEVATMSCLGYEQRKSSTGCSSSTTSQHSGCEITVPDGGIDAIRATASVQNKANKLEAKGISIYLRD